MLLKQRRKKINLRQKKLLTVKKRDLQSRNTDFKKSKNKCQITITCEQQHLYLNEHYKFI